MGRGAITAWLSLMAALPGLSDSAAGEGGGGPIGVSPPRCITAEDEARADALVQKYEQLFGPVSRPVPGQTPPPLRFYPLAGRLWRDLFTVYYVDLDPSVLARDFDCLQYTYNGHAGSDTSIRSFDEQIIGVPVYAADAGKVIAVHDGEPDMNITPSGQPANFVIIDQGLGRQAWYFHLKRNSILVGLGEDVVPGQPIGECGSSGNSSGPHLHFEIRDGDQPFEPYSGPCRSGASGWVAQPVPDRSVYLHDFGVTHENLSALPGWPYRWPASGQIQLSDPFIRVWFYGVNLPAESTWKVRFRRPDGTLVPGGQTQKFNNPFWSWFSWWWSYDVAEMHTTLGTWHVLLHINGVLLVEAPVEVVAERTAGFNRLPEPITARFEPLTPLEGDILSVFVNASQTLDDLDYDVVRYQYVWRVNNEVVRNVTTAAQSDVLRADFLQGNAIVSCSITPHDGTAAGETKLIVATVGTPPVPTIGQAGAVVLSGLLLGAGAWIIRRRRGLDGPPAAG